jgi:AraC-like DNA-binding protein
MKTLSFKNGEITGTEEIWDYNGFNLFQLALGKGPGETRQVSGIHSSENVIMLFGLSGEFMYSIRPEQNQLEVGYTSLSHFARVFAGYFGVKPSQARNLS